MCLIFFSVPQRVGSQKLRKMKIPSSMYCIILTARYSTAQGYVPHFLLRKNITHEVLG